MGWQIVCSIIYYVMNIYECTHTQTVNVPCGLMTCTHKNRIAHCARLLYCIIVPAGCVMSESMCVFHTYLRAYATHAGRGHECDKMQFFRAYITGRFPWLTRLYVEMVTLFFKSYSFNNCQNSKICGTSNSSAALNTFAQVYETGCAQFWSVAAMFFVFIIITRTITRTIFHMSWTMTISVR